MPPLCRLAGFGSHARRAFCRVKVLLDVNLSRRVAAELRRAGVIVHLVVDEMDPRSPDETVIEWAAHQGAVIVSRDQDFSAILAIRERTGPSLINLRVAEVDPARLAGLIAATIKTFSEDLSAGAVITLDDRHARIHRLPLDRE